MHAYIMLTCTMTRSHTMIVMELDHCPNTHGMHLCVYICSVPVVIFVSLRNQTVLLYSVVELDVLFEIWPTVCMLLEVFRPCLHGSGTFFQHSSGNRKNLHTILTGKSLPCSPNPSVNDPIPGNDRSFNVQ